MSDIKNSKFSEDIDYLIKELDADPSRECVAVEIGAVPGIGDMLVAAWRADYDGAPCYEIRVTEIKELYWRRGSV